VVARLWCKNPPTAGPLAPGRRRAMVLTERNTGCGGTMANWTDISTDITVHGSYSVSWEDKTITVNSPYGSKTTQIGGLRPEVLAKIMLRELVQDRRHQ